MTNLEDFTAALRRVAEGGSALDPQVVSQLLTKGRSANDPLNLLTPREREVIELVAEGRSNKGIGERLVITERAVQKHVTSIFMKLGLPQSDDDHRRILAVLAYIGPRELNRTRVRLDAPSRRGRAPPLYASRIHGRGAVVAGGSSRTNNLREGAAMKTVLLHDQLLSGSADVRPRARAPRREEGPRQRRRRRCRPRRGQRGAAWRLVHDHYGAVRIRQSTFLHVAAGLDRPDRGTISLGDTELTRLSERRLTVLRRERIGFVFQAFNLMPSLTVAQNIGLPVRLDGRRPKRSDVKEAAARVGLTDRLRHRPGQLSGGQQQRVAIARALIARPEIVFADEPTGALDTSNGGAVLELLRTLVDHDGRTVVMVTHDPKAAAFADRVIFLADGRIADTVDGASAEEVATYLAHLGARAMLSLAFLTARSAPRQFRRRAARLHDGGRARDGRRDAAASGAAHARSGRALLRRRGRGRRRPGRRARPRCSARRARPRRRIARRADRVLDGCARGDRRYRRSCTTWRARHGGAQLEVGRAYALRAHRGQGPAECERGRNRLPVARRRAARALVDRAGAPGHGRRDSAAAGFGRDAHSDLPVRSDRCTTCRHPGRVDAIGILAGPGFDASRLRQRSATRSSSPARRGATQNRPGSRPVAYD